MAQESPALMEPVLPPVGERQLEDRAFDLIQKASAMGGRVPDAVKAGVGGLVRSMNCYYSNLIEGHNTHPRDIDRALKNDYSADPKKRDLQREAVAHIHVQQLIDTRQDLDAPVTSVEYLTWIHRELCQLLPEDLLWVENPDTGERLRVEPGVLRHRTVQVGRLVPPAPDALRAFLARFAEAYDPRGMSRTQQVIAVAAAHHRLLWIHPFLDGNGRVARLMSHAWFVRLGIGDSLWSVARGLARRVDRYKALLMDADAPRRHDTDGRGTLSLEGLVRFTDFFLESCIDQVEFMEKLLEPATLATRLESYVAREAAAGTLARRSFPLLREALHMGQVERGAAAELLGVGERQARNIVAELIERGLLISESPRSPLRLGFPAAAVDAWFPRLYPEPLNG
jgi:Fic family protein